MTDNTSLEELQKEFDKPEPGDVAFLKRLQEFTQLENRRRELEFELESIELRTAALKPQLIEDMAEHGIQSTRANGLTVHTRTDWWVHRKEGATNQEVCDALHVIGRGDMVSDGYNPSSLKALVLEWKREEQEIPPALAGKIDIGSKVDLRTRK